MSVCLDTQSERDSLKSKQFFWTHPGGENQITTGVQHNQWNS